MENIFSEGSVVYARENPALALVVRRYVGRIYYCTLQNNPSHKELVYFERELMAQSNTASRDRSDGSYATENGSPERSDRVR